jgi:hypothetical protein
MNEVTTVFSVAFIMKVLSSWLSHVANEIKEHGEEWMGCRREFYGLSRSL